jgi:hypothetical protein
VHLLPLAVCAVFSLNQGLVKKTDKIICVLVSAQNNVAAFASISAIRSTPWNKLFPAKTHATPPAIAGFRRHPDPIDEHRLSLHATIASG